VSSITIAAYENKELAKLIRNLLYSPRHITRISSTNYNRIPRNPIQSYRVLAFRTY
jgi:hypothetical protein